MLPQLLTTLCFSLILLRSVRTDDCPANRHIELHDEARLHKDLLCDYNSDYRPVKNHTKTVTVKVRLSIKYLSFDYLEETFTLHSWVALAWKDEFLAWDRSQYGNIESIQMESHNIWTPEMALFNADVSVYQSDHFFTTCLVTYEGMVTCVPHLSHSGICRTSLRQWPYDTQNCSLYFGAWMHSGEQVNFTFYNVLPVVKDEYQNGPGWKLVKINTMRLPGVYSCCPNNTYPMLKYTFTLEREASGPAAIVVVPSVVIVLLTLTSVLLDIKDNIRLLIACFSLFSHFTYLSEIGYNIPKHGSQTPILLLFVRDSMVVTLVVITTTLLLMWMRKRSSPPAVFLQNLARLVHAGPGRYVVFTEFDPAVASAPPPANSDPSSTNKDTPDTEWLQLASFFNSLLFIIIFLTYLILIFRYIPWDDEQ